MGAPRHFMSVMLLLAPLALSTACVRDPRTDPAATVATAGPVSSRPVDGASSRAAGDYRITPSDPRQCDWITDEQGTIHIGGYFVSSYTGPAPVPTTIPYDVSDDIDANSDSGYTSLGPVRFSLPVVTRPAAYTYVLTVRLRPPSEDQRPGNETASLSIEVPVGTPLTIPEPLPCS